MALTKIEIVDSIANQIGYTKSYSSELIENLLEIMKMTLESGEDVLISKGHAKAVTTCTSGGL